MSRTEQTRDQITQLASKRLHVRPEDVEFTELTSEFPWAKRHRILWSTSPDETSVVLALAEGKPPMVLTDPSGLETLSEILVGEKGSLPADMSAKALAEAVRCLTVEPPGLVAGPEMLHDAKCPVEDWIPVARPQLEPLFGRYCKSPLLDRSPESGEWTLRFTYFNQRGGVERWRVAGDAKGIHEAKRSPAEPDGTFNWPFE